MGKYIRKPKTTRDVAVKDVSQSYLGVRTRARTLALQRLQSSSAAVADAPPPPTKPDFLELRSRRLEKPPLGRNFQNSRKPAVRKQGFVSREEGNPRFETSTAKSSSEPADFPIEPSVEADGGSQRLNAGLEIGDSEIEVSLGENNLDLEPRESRGTRESTPCSFIRPADSVTTPGSSTRQRSPSVSNPTAQNVRRDLIPSAREMDEFFAQAEKPQQQRFIEKYNFDIVNDMPLPGRYEWVKVMP